MDLIRLGLQLPIFAAPGQPAEGIFPNVVAAARTAEDVGFDSVWVMDHFAQLPWLGSRSEPMLEAYTLLGALAASTTSLNLGTLVTGVTYRNPALVAKMVTTLDVISGGRAICGLGAAWYEEEHAGHGYDFPPTGERLDRLDEALQIVRAMFREELPSFAGRYYRIHDAANWPRPVRPGGPPILVGGGGERRTLRLVAQYADACNVFGDAATVRHKLGVLDAHCGDVGRDPAGICRTRLGTLVLAKTVKEARASLVTLAERRGVDVAELETTVTFGDPGKVAEEVTGLLAAGLDGVIFNVPDPADVEAIALAGATLRPVVDAHR